MANRRSNSVFLVVNIVISLTVALLVIGAYTSLQEDDTRAVPTPISLIVTATPDGDLLPAVALQGTVDAQAGTITAYERNAAAVPVPQDGGEPNTIPTRQPQAAASDPDLPTIDPALIPDIPEDVPAAGGDTSAATLPADGCERYFVQAGDTASTIATRFEVGLSELLVLNGINDRTVLQIGDELLIPGETCEPEVPPTETPLPRPTFNLTIVAPTATLPQAAVDSQVRIVQVLNPGDITAEQIEIQNLGGQINLLGWTLEDGQGNIYTFPDVRLVPGSVIRIATRSGTNTPGFLYWNQTQAIWENGETATLSDAAGVVQSVVTVGGEEIEFDATATP